MRKVFIGLVLLVFGWAAAADTLRITRNVHLRAEPSTTSESLRVLEKGEEVETLEEPLTKHFFHVRTEEGEEGWIYSNYARPIPPAEVVLPNAAPQSAAPSVLRSWEKPQPVTKSFKLKSGSCPRDGSGDHRDKATNVRKNRIDIPQQYHEVTWRAIADLPDPHGPKSRADFSTDELEIIEQYEGVPVRTIGYVVAIKPQASNGESCNCYWKGEAATDWHIALVETPGEGEKTSIVVEPTPRIKKNHPGWTKRNLEPWLNQDLPVRISGWLLFDPQHTNHLKKYRSTLWEIHPITQIEVWDAENQTWLDLDDLPAKP